MLAQAQARARGYPNADPHVEPDAGWGGDPTEGNEDLVSVIRARQAACLTTFGAKNRRGRRIECYPNMAEEKLLQAGAAAQLGGAFPPLKPAGMLREVNAEAFSQHALYEQFRRAVDERMDDALWMSALGMPAGPDASLFERLDGSSKLGKRGRGRWIQFLADTLIDPAEVRRVDVPPNAPPEIRVLGGFARSDGRALYTLLLYRFVGEQWRGWSAYHLDSGGDLARYRMKSMPVWVRK